MITHGDLLAPDAKICMTQTVVSKSPPGSELKFLPPAQHSKGKENLIYGALKHPKST